MKHLYLMLLSALFIFPVCAQDMIAEEPAAEAPTSDTTVVEPPRVRVMPFLPYTGTVNLERTTRNRVTGTRVNTATGSRGPVVTEQRSFGIVFDEGSTDLNPLAVEKIRQVADKMRKYGTNRFVLITYYQEGNLPEKGLANRRLEIVNGALFDLGFKKTIQTYAYARKQIIANKDTVIVVIR